MFSSYSMTSDSGRLGIDRAMSGSTRCVYTTQEQLSVYLSQAVRESSETSQLRRAEWKRDTMYARELWRKVNYYTSQVVIHTCIYIPCILYSLL